MTSIDLDVHYLQARAAEERDRASCTTDPKVRQIHLEFAKKYESICISHDVDDHIQSSRDAICRSLNLLSDTRKFASD